MRPSVIHLMVTCSCYPPPCSPKAKTAKIVRSVIDSIAKVPNSSQLLVSSRAAFIGAWQEQETFATCSEQLAPQGADSCCGMSCRGACDLLLGVFSFSTLALLLLY